MPYRQGGKGSGFKRDGSGPPCSAHHVGGAGIAERGGRLASVFYGDQFAFQRVGPFDVPVTHDLHGVFLESDPGHAVGQRVGEEDDKKRQYDPQDTVGGK